jgi:hypothetical protein
MEKVKLKTIPCLRILLLKFEKLPVESSSSQLQSVGLWLPGDKVVSGFEEADMGAYEFYKRYYKNILHLNFMLKKHVRNRDKGVRKFSIVLIFSL